MIEARPLSSGQRIRVEFERTNSTRRQGVWLATEGSLDVNGVCSPQIVLWTDTTPELVEIEVVATDGLLRLYNVWDSGRGLGDYESQMATSGMLTDEIGPGKVRYRCNDIGLDPDFEKLTFTVTIE